MDTIQAATPNWPILSPITKCTTTRALFPSCKGRQINASFECGDITSDAGGLLLRQLDRELSLIPSVARRISDPRDQASCLHSTEQVIQQHVFGIAMGYGDPNEH